MRMIDVGAKPKTERVAVARGFISMSRPTIARIRRGEVEKGDVLAAARLAGVMAAKKTPDLVPLCHPIALSAVDVEATAGAAGCLTVYDMLKRYERGMRIEAVELLEKSGGRTGDWKRARPRAALRK